MPKIAESVGWLYYDARTQVLSRFPLLTPRGDKPYVFVEVKPGRVVAVANVHLPSTSYGPFKAGQGATEEELLATEQRKRVPALMPSLNAVEKLAAQGVPVFLLGDFNAPSHLDWTEEAVGTREQIRFPVAWPASLAVEAAGLVDSYRAVHPDPVVDPGLTWPANRPVVPGYNPFRHGAERDRIDFVYAGGPARVTDSRIVGEEGEAGVDVPVAPWPTDHRALVSTFEVDAAPAPTIVSVARRLVVKGEDVVVRYHARSGDAASLVVVRAGGDPELDAVDEVGLLDEEAAGGELALPTERWRPGSYDVVLVSASGEELARAPVWVAVEGRGPQLRVDEALVSVGDPIGVRWTLAPGNRRDWLAIYRRGARSESGQYLLWTYTGASIEGSAVFDDAAAGSWPLPPGEYTVYLLEDDDYVALASGDVTIR
jgi:hypothetical protein